MGSSCRDLAIAASTGLWEWDNNNKAQEFFFLPFLLAILSLPSCYTLFPHIVGQKTVCLLAIIGRRILLYRQEASRIKRSLLDERQNALPFLENYRSLSQMEDHCSTAHWTTWACHPCLDTQNMTPPRTPTPPRISSATQPFTLSLVATSSKPKGSSW